MINSALQIRNFSTNKYQSRDGHSSIYHEPSFTGLYTRWDSYPATKYKINLVRALVHRILRICSPAVVEIELRSLRDIFSKNGYPDNVLEKYITRSKSENRFIGPQRCPVMIHLPWTGPKSSLFEKKISSAVRVAYFAAKVHFIYSTNRAFNLPKDKLPTPSMSNIIYLYECRRCESQYVGKTTQNLIARIKQHVPRHLLPQTADGPQTKKRGRPPKSTKDVDFSSAIAQHLADNEQCRQSYSDEHFTVLSRARSKFHLDVLEAAFIHTLRPVLCRQKSFVVSLKLFPSRD